MSFPDIQTILQSFNPVSLEEMASVRLMNRIDTKYVFCASRIPDLLTSLAGSYNILEIGQERAFNYNTNYLDTGDLLFYNQHVTGKLARHKIRYRKYKSTGNTFLEIKRKTNKNRTIKWRIENTMNSDGLDEKASQFIKKHIPFNSFVLHPVLMNRFTRITLTGNDTKERITFDTDLCFSSMNGETAELPYIVIAELKSEGNPSHSAFVKAARQNGIYPTGFSKYCVGNALLLDVPKKNSIKPKLLLLNKIKNEYSKLYVSG
jgi:hypothetical protein